MKSAIVILAHSHVKYVRYLYSLLSTKFEVFIHWDLVGKIPDEIAHYNLIPSRNHCLWGSFDLWESQWKSLCHVFKNSSANNVSFISEFDIPLMTIEKLAKELGSIHNSLVQCDDKSGTYRGEIADAFIPYGLRYNLIRDKALTLIGDKYRNRMSDRFSSYIGSQWVTLNRDDFMKMVSYVQDHPQVIEALKCSLISDEMGFQYLINAIGSKFDDYRRLIKWDSKSTHPIPLGWSEVSDMISSGQNYNLFGRKINPDEILLYSNELTELLTAP